MIEALRLAAAFMFWALVDLVLASVWGALIGVALYGLIRKDE